MDQTIFEYCSVVACDPVSSALRLLNMLSAACLGVREYLPMHMQTSPAANGSSMSNMDAAAEKPALLCFC